jgi:hypothetical protein
MLPRENYPSTAGQLPPGQLLTHHGLVGPAQETITRTGNSRVLYARTHHPWG